MKSKSAFLVFSLLLFFINSFSQNLGSNTRPNKDKFGFGIGVGLAGLTLKQTNWNVSGNIYNDSLTKITEKFNSKFDLYLFYQVSLKENIELRPTFSLVFGDGGKIEYDRKIGNSETLKLGSVPIFLSCPILLKFPSTQNRFYVNAGPSVLYMLGQEANVKKLVPLKKFDLLLDVGVGFDIGIKSIVLTPELRYSVGFSNLYKNNNNLYTNTIEKINRQGLTLSFLFRDRL